MPKISVVIASYNHEAFVRQSIDSVLGQSVQDIELVVTDDGSSDGTVAAIREVRDPRVRLRVLEENRGACVALNDAITRATGDYIAVLNSDDYFLPGKLERQAAFLDAHPEIGAVFGLPEFVDERGNRFSNPLHAFANLFTAENRSRCEWLREFFQRGNCLCHPTIMIRRSCYDAIGLLDPLLMQIPDLDLWVRLCSRFEIHVLPEPLTAFRILDRERNTSAPSPERLARSAWESAAVLGHFARLPEADLRVVLGCAPGEAETPLRIQLALAALRIGHPGYAPFGLDLLRTCMREDPDVFPAPEYFRLVGAADPFAAEYRGREFQALRRSRVRKMIRRVWRLVRSWSVRR